MESIPFYNDYLLLGLRIGKHRKGYVDFYYGPPRLEAQVENERLTSPKNLLKDCIELQNDLENQGFDGKREIYLEKTLKAIKVTIESEFLKLKRPVEEVFKLQTDMELRPFKESELEELKAKCAEAYGATGSLSERMAEMREKRTIPKNAVLNAIQRVLDITKQKTRELFPDMLPKEEEINLEVVSSNNDSVKWSAYNWYKGNFKSLVQINTDFCMYWTGFLRIGAHEGYIGHHAAFAVAEDKLYREENHFDRAIYLYNTPYMIICEGIADIGLDVLFSSREQEEIALREFCPDPRNGPTIEELVGQNQVRVNLKKIEFNTAYHKLIDNWKDKEVFDYLNSFEIFGNKLRDNIVKSLNSPIFRLTNFAYYLGRSLIAEKFGEHPSPQNFRYLLENPVLPSDLK